MQTKASKGSGSRGRVDSGQAGSSKRSLHHEQSLPPLPPPPPDRRAVSAPVYARFSKQVNALPSIMESQSSEVEKARIVSAPPQSKPSRANRHDGTTTEYLTKVENSIRVVNSPAHQSPVKAPQPLNVRKKSAYGERFEPDGSAVFGRPDPFMPLGAPSTTDPSTPSPIPARSQQQDPKKKRSLWFKRNSKEQLKTTSLGTAEGDTPHSQESYGTDPYVDPAPTHPPPIPAKKKGIFRSIFKSSKLEPKMSIAGKNPQSLDSYGDISLTKQTTPTMKTRPVPK